MESPSGTSSPAPGSFGLEQRYQDAEDLGMKLDLLARNFSQLEVPQVIELYESYIGEMEDLIAEEVSPDYTEPLETLRSQLLWQLECLRKASTYENSETAQDIHPLSGKQADPRLQRIEETKRLPEGRGLDDVAGLDGVKRTLRKSIILPMQFPCLFTGGRKPWTQVLLFGPPGTGKSKIAFSLAQEAKAELYSISSADLLSSWVGESENIKNQLLIELDWNLTTPTNCFVLCATNCPWDIDPAFLRRFQRRIFIPLPDREARFQIMKMNCEGVSVELTQLDWDEVLDLTEGYSGSDLVNLTRAALQEPLSEVETAKHWVFTHDGSWMPCPSNTLGCFSAPLSVVPSDKVSVRPVSVHDFKKAVESTPKTVSNSDMDKYRKFLE